MIYMFTIEAALSVWMSLTNRGRHYMVSLHKNDPFCDPAPVLDFLTLRKFGQAMANQVHIEGTKYWGTGLCIFNGDLHFGRYLKYLGDLQPNCIPCWVLENPAVKMSEVNNLCIIKSIIFNYKHKHGIYLFRPEQRFRVVSSAVVVLPKFCVPPEWRCCGSVPSQTRRLPNKNKR